MDNLQRVNMEQMIFAKKCFEQSPLIQMARQMIHNQLLNNGIKFSQGKSKKGFKMSPEEEDDVDDKWVPFCASIIDSVMCFGVAVVHIGKCYPTVLNLKTFWLKTGIKNNETVWEIYEKGAAEKPIRNAVVFDHFGFHTDGGNINSLMLKVLPRLQFMKNIRQTAIRMEANRSMPQYFAEIKDSGNSNQNREGIDFDFYADANAAETSDGMKFQRNRTAVSMLNAQKDLYENYLGNSHAAKASAALENVTQLPMGQMVKNAVSNTGRSDMANLHKLFQEEVCATFGVPRSMMFADGSGNRSQDTLGSHQTFMHTLLWWKKKLSVVLSECYNAIHAEKIISTIDVKKDTCVDDLKRQFKVNVYFPVTPFVSNDELRKLYEQGIISWKSYGEYALRNISLPISDLQAKAPEIDQLLFEKPKVEKPTAKGEKPEGDDNKKRKAEGEVDGEKEKKKEKKEKDKKEKPKDE
jgi:hypothetical protein